ncbi:MAG: hypothetical protein AAFX87_25145 [Bacteroidota bacterium]
MMSILITWLFLNLSVINGHEQPDLKNLSSAELTIEAVDISENMSRVSTQNDELLVIVYDYEEQEMLADPLLVKKQVFNAKETTYKIDASSLLKAKSDKLLFFFIEQDVNRSVEQIDPVLRVHHKRITELFDEHELYKLEKYLGDEDLLGIKVISKFQSKNKFCFAFSGYHKGDRYHYLVELKKLN